MQIAALVILSAPGCSLIKEIVASPKAPPRSTVASFFNKIKSQSFPKNGKAKVVMKTGAAIAAIPKSNDLWLSDRNELRQLIHPSISIMMKKAVYILEKGKTTTGAATIRPLNQSRGVVEQKSENIQGLLWAAIYKVGLH